MKKNSLKMRPTAWLTTLATCLLLTWSSPVQAGDIKLQAGTGVTTQIMPLFGLDLIASYKTEGLDLGLIGFDNQETSFTYHNLSGSGNLSDRGLTAAVTVQLIAYEFSYFLEKDIGGFSFGPGIGYGFAEMTEDLQVSGGNQLGDPSPFYTAKDIHYGALLLRGSMSWDLVTCDGIVNSWGGLIGGSLVCGLQF
ncbi:MAG: hypothetical protein RRB13_00250 [bacterium]|nr:hypothetical protein [bacterium]